MQKKEIKKWQDEEALKRYRMIARCWMKGWMKGKGGRCGKKPPKKTAYPKGAFTGMRQGIGTTALKGCAQ